MNKQSNVYTTIYIILLVVIVGTALAVTSLSLHDRQQANIDADKQRQILAAVHVTADAATISETYNKYITESLVTNERGTIEEGVDAFGVNVSAEVKKPAAERQLPVFIATLDDRTVKYVLPVYGAGLWGPIWGYIALDSDGSTIYGAYFAHQGETPGLGAEIEKPHFCDEFNQKELFKDGRFFPVEVVKAGQHPVNADADYVDGVTGGTITSKGVGAMIDNSLTPYQAYLKTLSEK